MTSLNIHPGTPTPLSHYLELPRETLLNRYSGWAAHVPTRVLELEDEYLDTAFVESAGLGRWPARVLIGHLADCELVYTHRMRRVASEDNPTINGFDTDAMIDAGLYGNQSGGTDKPIGAYIAVIHTLRTWTAEWLSTLDDQAFERKGLHQEDGPVSIEGLLAKAVWHIEHHAVFLNRKVDHLLGPERV